MEDCNYSWGDGLVPAALLLHSLCHGMVRRQRVLRLNLQRPGMVTPQKFAVTCDHCHNAEQYDQQRAEPETHGNGGVIVRKPVCYRSLRPRKVPRLVLRPAE